MPLHVGQKETAPHVVPFAAALLQRGAVDPYKSTFTSTRAGSSSPFASGKRGGEVERMALNLVCAVLDRGPDDLAEMAVLLALADGADKESGETWPSQATIARRSRQTDRSVRNVLERLRAGGWLTWEPRLRPNGSRASNCYTLNLEKLGEARAVSPAKAAAAVPVKAAAALPVRASRSEPRSGGGRNHVPPRPEPRSGYAPEPRSGLEPSQKKEPCEAVISPVDEMSKRAALAASLGLPVRDKASGGWRSAGAAFAMNGGGHA